MPKKLGVNTKALEAKMAKESAKRFKEELLQKQKEDEYWRDDDKLINRKLERQQAREEKKQETLLRKAQNRAAYEAELKSIPNAKNKDNPKKITRLQIQNFVERKQKPEAVPLKKEPTHLEVPLEENLNRMTIEGEEARNIDQAITILSAGEPEFDRHPERRMKAAWVAYEEKHLQRLKKENPTLRLSQIKQLLRKEFERSSENPKNQESLILSK